MFTLIRRIIYILAIIGIIVYFFGQPKHGHSEEANNGPASALNEKTDQTGKPDIFDSPLDMNKSPKAGEENPKESFAGKVTEEKENTAPIEQNPLPPLDQNRLQDKVTPGEETPPIQEALPSEQKAEAPASTEPPISPKENFEENPSVEAPLVTKQETEAAEKGTPENPEAAPPSPSSTESTSTERPSTVTDENMNQETEEDTGTYAHAVKLRGLNKITAHFSTLSVPLGKEIRFGTLSISVEKCWKSPPDQSPENKALLKISEQKPNEKPVELFYGWMFSSSPGISALEHPVYDITVLGCGT